MRSRTANQFRSGVAAMMAASTVLGGACYRYTPIDLPSSALGADVRVRLTDAGAITLAPLIGNRIELVDGRVSSIADTSVTLAVTGTTDRLGVETPWRGEQVTFPRTTLDEFQGRSLDRRRSYVAGGIAAGLVAAVGIGFSIAGNGGGGRTSGTGSPK